MERNKTVCHPNEEDRAQGTGEIGTIDGPMTATGDESPMTEAEALKALQEYEELQDTIREFQEERQWVVQKLTAWLEQQGAWRTRLEGRERTRTLVLARTGGRTAGDARVLRVS